MLYILLLLTCSAICELLIHAIPAKERYMRICISLAAIYAVGFVTVLGFMMAGLAAITVGFFSAYRVFSLLRIVRHRIHDEYLRHVTLRTSLWLLAAQYISLGLWALSRMYNLAGRVLFVALLIVELAAAVIFLYSSLKHVRRMRAQISLAPMHDKDLPTVTVAIPARNETFDLEECLHSVLQSDYPKLEIIVLDDSSQTTRTPEIIRSFAHDGVRFIQGSEPRNGWLAKNQAYETLAHDANSQIILFAGVDVRFEPQTIRRLVQYMHSKNKTMLCVMPNNTLDSTRLPLLQPMRYFWELALPRKALGRPPVLSTCWLITRAALQKSGGFEAVSRMVIPEKYLAQRQMAQDGYGFIASGSVFGLRSVKSAVEQRATAIRTAYPMLHRRPETVALLTLCYGAGTVSPAVALVLALTSPRYIPAGLVAILICVVLSATYAAVLALAYGKDGRKYTVSLPLALLIYTVLINYSMYKYEFSEVVWKGRDVSEPVMHVTPKLPPF